MRKRATGAVALAIAAALMLGLASVASAGLERDEVNIKFKPTLDKTKLIYKGKVSSDNPDCVGHRVISFKVKDKRLAKTRTDDRGKFKVKGKRPKSGTKIAVKVKPRGEDCPRLAGKGVAP